MSNLETIKVALITVARDVGVIPYDKDKYIVHVNLVIHIYAKLSVSNHTSDDNV